LAHLVGRGSRPLVLNTFPRPVRPCRDVLGTAPGTPPFDPRCRAGGAPGAPSVVRHAYSLPRHQPLGLRMTPSFVPPRFRSPSATRHETPCPPPPVAPPPPREGAQGPVAAAGPPGPTVPIQGATLVVFGALGPPGPPVSARPAGGDETFRLTTGAAAPSPTRGVAFLSPPLAAWHVRAGVPPVGRAEPPWSTCRWP